jgi:hypothetical protein
MRTPYGIAGEHLYARLKSESRHPFRLRREFTPAENLGKWHMKFLWVVLSARN